MENLIPNFIFSVIMMVIVVVIVLTMHDAQNRRRAIAEFAARNKLVIRKEVWNGDFQDKLGLLFQLGHGRQIRNSVYGHVAGFETWLYQYNFTTGSGKNSRTHTETVCEIKIGNRLPHIFIDSKLTGQGVSPYVSEFIQKSNHVPVTSGFEQYFTLYAQTGLEQEALEIFTPDVLEKISTYARMFDLEFVGETMYVYQPSISNKPEDYQYMFETAAYLAGVLREGLKDFKMPPLPTKPGADFDDPRQITRLTARQQVVRTVLTTIGFAIGLALYIWLETLGS